MALGQDLNEDPPADPGGTSGGKPLGVPEFMWVEKDGKRTLVPYTTERRGFREQRANRFNPAGTPYTAHIPPKYFDGDEFRPKNWPTDQIFQMQKDLAKIGLLTGKFTPNIWDPTSRNAYKLLLGNANASGNTVQQELAESLATAGEGDQGGRWTVDEFGNVVPAGVGEGPPPLVKRVTDPAALRQTFRRAVIELLGEGWSTEQINKMVKAYNTMEAERQTQEHNLTYGLNEGGAGGTVNTIPTPTEFIEAEALKQDPGKAQVSSALNFTQDFMDAVSSPAWGVG